jgi:glutamyl-tRNA synthetase
MDKILALGMDAIGAQGKRGAAAQPIRVAISGTTVSPPIFHSLEFLGKERSMARIDRCLASV